MSIPKELADLLNRLAVVHAEVGEIGKALKAFALGGPQPVPVVQSQRATPDAEEVPCPKCGGKTWDNRLSKRNPKAPDYKCRSRSCDGAIWPPKGAEFVGRGSQTVSTDELHHALRNDPDDLPF